MPLVHDSDVIGRCSSGAFFDLEIFSGLFVHSVRRSDRG